MLRERKDYHEDQRAKVRKSGEDEGVGAAGGVASGEVAGAPDENGGQAAGCGRELGRGRHECRG